MDYSCDYCYATTIHIFQDPFNVLTDRIISSGPDTNLLNSTRLDLAKEKTRPVPFISKGGHTKHGNGSMTARLSS